MEEASWRRNDGDGIVEEAFGIAQEVFRRCPEVTKRCSGRIQEPPRGSQNGKTKHQTIQFYCRRCRKRPFRASGAKEVARSPQPARKS